ncbi:VOC family protein [Ensifer sp. 4252]|uniref:VOC family protein n=1 Tax=Ensifer sp. 4252 TaxID=3373915 RepID=UPI003D219476
MAPALEGILETALYVDDLDAAEAFYGGVLGLERIGRVGNRHVFFRCGQSVLLIFNPAETIKPSPPDARYPVPPHGTDSGGHMCFRLASDTLDAWKAKLEAAGIAIEAEIRWTNGVRSFYFRDPAGNSLECAEAALWDLE